MTLTPLLTAPLPIQIHILAALMAMVIGPFAIWRKRRDRIHRTLGGTWIAAMLAVAISGLFIHETRVIGPFSPIHIFSLITLRSLWVSISHLRARRFAAHGAEMKGLYIGAMGIAGFLTMLPGRRMNQMLFGEAGEAGFALMLVAAVVVGGALLRRRMRAGAA